MDWHPRTSVCWASATREWAKDVLTKRHEKDDPRDGHLHPLAGRSVWVSRMAPDPDEDEFA